MQRVEAAPLADLQVLGVQGEKQRRKDGREVPATARVHRKTSTTSAVAGDQGGQAGDDQVLAEQPEPLGEEDREQRRAIVVPSATLSCPSASQDWAARK